MAHITNYCLTCQATYGDPIPAPHLKQDDISTGYCPPHGEEYLADIRRQNEERKRLLCVGRVEAESREIVIETK